jgi:hypothetical protein
MGLEAQRRTPLRHRPADRIAALVMTVEAAFLVPPSEGSQPDLRAFRMFAFSEGGRGRDRPWKPSGGTAQKRLGETRFRSGRRLRSVWNWPPRNRRACPELRA